ncbi:hypothetical protein [Longitalea arenae]|uniref:hypothetical protein n=1 Tax=Longitalea arenae TaxID=2812558 RepID=UPI001968835F|nr:hypothetical protein [Longitalea arenae]
MKKGFFDTTALLSFFNCIPCKTNTIKSVQCKPGASRSAGPHKKKFSGAYNKIMDAANTGSDAKLRSIIAQIANENDAAFCVSQFVLASVHRL